MKAWRVHEYGNYSEQLRLEEAPDPDLPSAGAVIAVRAAAANFPDLLAIAGTYQVKAPLPFIPGLEVMGEVIEVGAESRLEPGQRVIANGPWGGFAEKFAAPDSMIYPVPESMPGAVAAGFHVTYQTSLFALTHRANLQAGETLLVHGGAGGVGSAAIQLGKAFGARVIATARGQDKLARCRELGADHTIDYAEEDFVPAVKAITDGRGADVIYDPIGGEVFDKSSKCIAFGGRLIVIGFAGGTIPSIAANRILLKNMSVVGLHWGAYYVHQPALIREAHDELCKLYESGSIAPLVGLELPFEKLPEALDALAQRRAVGKVVVTP